MPCEVTVKYFAPIREKTGCEEEIINLKDGSRLKDLVRLVSERYCIEPALIASCLLTVNGKGASQLSGPETELRPGDRVCFMPPISGG